jgi:hypothetical protein
MRNDLAVFWHEQKTWLCIKAAIVSVCIAMTVIVHL